MIASPSQLTERERDFILSFTADVNSIATNTLAERMNTSVQQVNEIGVALKLKGLVCRDINRETGFPMPGRGRYMLLEAGKNIYNQLMEEM